MIDPLIYKISVKNSQFFAIIVSHKP